MTPGLRERLADVGALGQRQRQQDALDRDVAVAGLVRDLLGLVEQADECRRRAPGAEVAPLPVTAGILATSASTSRRAACAVAAGAR